MRSTGSGSCRRSGSSGRFETLDPVRQGRQDFAIRSLPRPVAEVDHHGDAACEASLLNGVILGEPTVRQHLPVPGRACDRRRRPVAAHEPIAVLDVLEMASEQLPSAASELQLPARLRHKVITLLKRQEEK